MIPFGKHPRFGVAAQIHTLQRAAYAVEAERIGCADFPPLRETIEVLQGSTDCFWCFSSVRISLAVFPTNALDERYDHSARRQSPAFRRGIATALLRALGNRLPVGSVGLWHPRPTRTTGHQRVREREVTRRFTARFARGCRPATVARQWHKPDRLLRNRWVRMNFVLSSAG